MEFLTGTLFFKHTRGGGGSPSHTATVLRCRVILLLRVTEIHSAQVTGIVSAFFSTLQEINIFTGQI